MLLFVKISRTSNEKYSQFCFLLLYTLYTYKNNIFRISCFYNKKKLYYPPMFSPRFFTKFLLELSQEKPGENI